MPVKEKVGIVISNNMQKTVVMKIDTHIRFIQKQLLKQKNIWFMMK